MRQFILNWGFRRELCLSVRSAKGSRTGGTPAATLTRGILDRMPKAKSNPSHRIPRVAIAIMAAGKGTRLKSKHPKVLHEVGGKPLLAHVIAAAMKVVPAKDVYAIIGHEADRVRQAVAHTGVGFVLQAEQRGTGHALMVAREALARYDQVIVLSGDAPLISPQTIRKLGDFHSSKRPAMTILTAQLQDPTGYGRVIRKSQKSPDVKAIVEEKSATPAQRKIREINSGFYAFDAKLLFAHIDELGNDNPHGEFYLTDLAAILGKGKKRVMAVAATLAELSPLACSNVRLASLRSSPTLKCGPFAAMTSTRTLAIAASAALARSRSRHRALPIALRASSRSSHSVATCWLTSRVMTSDSNSTIPPALGPSLEPGSAGEKGPSITLARPLIYENLR